MRRSKNWKRTASITLVLVMIFSSLVVFSSAATTASDAKNSVVVVQSEDGSTYGSGFVIGQVGKPVQYVVTNEHIVDGEYGNSTATVYFSIAADKKALATIFFHDTERDLAILRLPDPTTEREAFPLCPMSYADPDGDYTILGYPSQGSSSWVSFSTDDITMTKTGIVRANRVNNHDVYQLDSGITYGNTGGPLVNASGEIVGINDILLGDGKNALVVDELLTILDTERIPVTIHGQGGIPMLLILAAVIAVVIVVLIILLVSRSKKKSGMTDYIEPIPGVNSDTEVVKPGPGSQPGPGARVLVTGGLLAGKKFTVSGAIKIGRDKNQCSIVYPMDTKGVSGVHCEISYNGSVCYVKDLGSSYGTFLMNGTKLAKDVPQILKSGDRFYLASPENTFEVHF